MDPLKRHHVRSSPDFHIEEQYDGIVAGFDEVGCGPWAGPVVAGGVVLIREKIPHELASQIQDSKKLTPLKRLKVFQALKALEGTAVFWAVGLCSVREIEALNIRQAALKAMERAEEALVSLLPSHLSPVVGLVDGRAVPRLSCPVHPVVKGDQLSLTVAAASVFAKITRDQMMKNLSTAYPHYGWDRNAGYGTKAHRHALETYGPTVHHRRTFAPIRTLINGFKG